MTYYLYHIPGKKIGVTRDLNTRLTVYQGYKPNEYKVLEQSDDIDYISKREIELQKEYGYEADHTIYSKLGGKMKVAISSTDVTTTFRCPINELKGKLEELKGQSFSTVDGKYNLDDNLIAFILRNVQPSKYRDTSCYVYNNQLKNYNNKSFEIEFDEVENTSFDKIRDWAKERGLYDKGDTKTQFCKLMEEAGELGRAVLKDDKTEFIDAIGDMIVVLTNMAHLGGTTVEHCIDSAYEVISKRTGKMVNGTFVKDN
jgi:NTP pyrophosphatase (non-canonical NTP hydrolase)